MSPQQQAALAAERLTAAWARAGKNRRTLAPWDEFDYFDLPVETLVSVNNINWVSVAIANVRRVALIFAVPTSGGTAFVSTAQGGVANSGIPLSPTIPPVLITQRRYGNLCQVQWFGSATVATGITVIEVLLHDW